MIKKMNIFFAITAIVIVLTPQLTHSRGGWGAFGGALVGTAVVGTAVAASQDRAARRAAERDYYYSRMADREMQARNYEQQIANQRLLDENERQRKRIQKLNERMNAIENRTTNNRKMINQRLEQQEMGPDEEYSY